MGLLSLFVCFTPYLCEAETLLIHPNHSETCTLVENGKPIPLNSYDSHLALPLVSDSRSFENSSVLVLLPEVVAEVFGDEVSFEELESAILLGEDLEETAEAFLNHPYHHQPQVIPEPFRWNPLTDNAIQIIDGEVYDLTYAKFKAQMNFIFPFDSFGRLARGEATVLDQIEIAMTFLIVVPVTKSFVGSISSALRGPCTRFFATRAITQRQNIIRSILRTRGIEDIYTPHFLKLEIGKPLPRASFPANRLVKKARPVRLAQLEMVSAEEMHAEAMRIARSTSQRKLSFKHQNGKTYIFDGDTDRMLMIKTKTQIVETIFPYEIRGPRPGMPRFRDPLERFLVRFLNNERVRPLHQANPRRVPTIQEFVLGPEARKTQLRSGTKGPKSR